MQDRDSVALTVDFANGIKAEGITDVVLLGMGGSSMAPEVLRSIVGTSEGYPALHVVDSTDPAQILSVEHAIDFRRSMFLLRPNRRARGEHLNSIFPPACELGRTGRVTSC